MSSSCSQSRPTNSRSGGETLLDEVLASAAVLDDLLEPRKPEYLAGGIVRLHEAVAVEQDDVARSEVGLVLLVGHTGHGAERHSGGAKLCDPVHRRRVGEVVPRVRVAQPSRSGIEHRVETGDEHVRGDVEVQAVVGPLEHGARGRQPPRLAAQDAVGLPESA
jgi:hypothetical protein